MMRLRDGRAGRGRSCAGAREGPATAAGALPARPGALFRGRLDEAVALTERELALNPPTRWRSTQLGDALVAPGAVGRGDRGAAKSIWLNPYYSAPYILLGRAYMQKGIPPTAEGMLRRAIAYDPNNRTAHYLLGQLLQQTGPRARRRSASSSSPSSCSSPGDR